MLFGNEVVTSTCELNGNDANAMSQGCWITWRRNAHLSHIANWLGTPQ